MMKTLRNLFTACVILCLPISLAAKEEFLSESDYNKKELALLTYTEALIEWRQKLNKHYTVMAKSTRENGGVLDARELETLRDMVGEFHELHALRFQPLMNMSPNLLDENNLIASTSEESQIKKFVRFNNLRNRKRDRRGFRFDKTPAYSFKVNIEDSLGRRIFKHFRLQLAAKLVWLESYTLGFAPFFETGAFRQVLIRDLDKVEETAKLEKFWFQYMEEVVKTQSLSRTIMNYKTLSLKKLHQKSRYDKAHDYMMNEIITKNAVLSEIDKYAGGDNFFESMFRNMSFMAKRRWDGYRKVGVASLYQGSKLFGNTVGLVQTRRGYLYSWTKEQEEEISSQLRALDVLFEKTPFRLTDRFIPGFYGHNAIWSGTEEELRELGVWEHLKPEFQKGVREGRRVIEALRPGVQFNTFRHFLDIDDFSAMRLRNCGEDESPWKEGSEEIHCLNDKLKKEYLITAFNQVGKDYDFAFDVNTEETIVCSELLYRTFLDIDFDTTLTVGMHNISPDQVAYRGIEGPFEYFILINEGEYVQGDSKDLAEKVLSLMKN